MLRIIHRRCFHCSNSHQNVKIHNFYSTNSSKVEVNVGESSKIEISSGQLARLADGTAVTKIGNTAVMTTVVSKGKPSSQNFVPLTVDYRQKAAAAGRIPTNFLRRELGASDREILVGRMVDRSIRPLFKEGYNIETGINCNLLSVDGVHNPEVASICGASAALALSDVPWGPPIGAVQLGYENGKIVVNPTRKQLARSSLNLLVAGTGEGLATMLEGDARCLDHKTFLEAIKVGLENCATIANSIEELSKHLGKTKREITSARTLNSDEASLNVNDFTNLIETLSTGKLRNIYTDYSLDKQARDKLMFQVRDQVIEKIRSMSSDADPVLLNNLFSKNSKNIVRNLIFQEKIRVDGRGLHDIRPINCSVNLHSPLHGSALFQRGQTQVLCTVALDSLHSAQKLDQMTALTGGVKEKNFMLHYEFPGYATGELGKGGARRELGHGALAERALRQVLPGDSQFTIRLTSEVLESNGSSSMASICGGSMALLDAGIPLSELVSGVAMGLVTDETRGEAPTVLTDINGMEDFLGDMDFKFAASRSGVCALQADVKLPGIHLKIIEDAIEGGMEANHKILDIMSSCINIPRESKNCWPVTSRLEVPPQKRAKFLGQAGLNIRRLTEDTGVQFNLESEGVWQMFAPNPESMAEAEAQIQQILAEEKVPELDFGGIYTGKITEVLDRGIMIQLHEQMSPVLLHNSQLSAAKIHHPSALNLKVGQDLQVKYFGRDPVSGQMRLSRKALTVSSTAAVRNLQRSMKRKDDQELSPQPDPGETVTRHPTFVINENKDDFVFLNNKHLTTQSPDETKKAELIDKIFVHKGQRKLEAETIHEAAKIDATKDDEFVLMKRERKGRKKKNGKDG